MDISQGVLMATNISQAGITQNKTLSDILNSSVGRNISRKTSYRLKKNIMRLKHFLGRFAYASEQRKMSPDRKKVFLNSALQSADNALKKALKFVDAQTKKKPIKENRVIKKIKSKKSIITGEKSPKHLIKSKGLLQSGMIKKQGHAKSRTKRAQGKKDNR